MTMDWSIIDSAGPQDVEPVGQAPLFAEYEVGADPSVVRDPVQDPEPSPRLAAVPGATRSAFLNAAKAEVGYRESPRNANKYGKWYGMDGQPYCAMGLSWVAAQVGAAGQIGGKWAYCPYWAAWWREHGQWGLTPQVGAIAFFDWSGRRQAGREAHVGTVTAVGGSSITTVEFNTVSGAGNQSDGGGVYVRSRALSTVVGYGLPSWAPERATTTLPTPGRVPLVVDGAWGRKTTLRLQEVLRVPRSGSMDPVSISALAVWLRQAPVRTMTPLVRTALQSRVGVPRDGVIGSTTVKALQRYLNRV
jgi:surface antigen